MRNRWHNGDARAATIERLERDPFDLVVIGGGIVGAGTAALATRSGLRVALLERHDFGSGTSSASSKLVHGGLRYLRMGDVGLVRRSLAEAATLRRVVAPHLVEELRFVLPVYRGGPYSRTAIRSALRVYSALAGSVRGGGLVAPGDARRLVPPLRQEGLVAAGIYADARTDDARLCLANVRAAAEAGAAVANRVEVVGLERRGRSTRVSATDLLAGRALEIAARAVVNASGPWVDSVRRFEDPRAGASVALSKGTHLVLERPGDWGAALTVPVDRDRVSFAIPWQGLLLLGTTDDPFDPEVDTLEVTPREEAQILAEAGLALTGEALRPEAIRARFAGVRVLPLGARGTVRARREVTLTCGPLGMVSVAGGKLTTYRLIADAVLERLGAELGVRRVDRSAVPLPGAAVPAAAAARLRKVRPTLDPELALHLARVYGTLAKDVLDAASARVDALEPLAPGAPDVVAQALYARDAEWATDPEDVLRRRTTLALHGFDTPEVRARLGRLLEHDAPAESRSA